MTSLNMRAIQTVTVGAGGAASIDFTSIPQTYTDLIVKLSVRTTRTGTDVDDEIYLEFNGSGGTAYSVRVVEGNGTTSRSAQTLSSANMGRGIAPSDNATANTFSNCEYYITNYAGSTNKSVSFDNTMENNATQSIMNLASGLWSNTSAITSMRFTAVGTFDQYSTATLYGVFSAALGAKATGGNISADANYIYHTFLSSGTFTPTQSISADILVVAGGGGTSGDSGGGGAGGLLTFTSQSLTAQNYTCTVGAGGVTSTAYSVDDATSGGNSQFGSLTACVGGGRARFRSQNPVGGSGAGGNSDNGGGITTPANGTSGQGNAGGTASFCTGGGGGAGGVGGNANGSVIGGTGGIGATSSLINAMGAATNTGQLSGGNYYYAGGGAGWYGSPSPGLGGGGFQGLNGTANTGGGGGAYRANGGSGIIIVRYAR